jgi:hypothetical protein
MNIGNIVITQLEFATREERKKVIVFYHAADVIAVAIKTRHGKSA